MTPTQNEEIIDFPADLMLKAMGHASEDFERLVADIVNKHLSDGKSADISVLASSKGKFVSVRARFTAESREQLEKIYLELHESEHVLYTL